VSMNRPFHAFRAFYGGVEEARTREMGEFMRMFRDVFFNEFERRPSPDEMLSPIQDVVFDHRGAYYAAVPLEFGSGADELKRRKARYIANIMFALETRGFVTLISRNARAPESDEAQPRGRMERMIGKRGWSDLSAFARGQLRARNSEFAEAPDFRVYKFAKGKWPEIALRTVVSAHKEESAYRQDVLERHPVVSNVSVDRGPLNEPSGNGDPLEGTEPRPQIEHYPATEEAEDRRTSPEAKQDAALEWRDEEPEYGPQEDYDPNQYSTKLWREPRDLGKTENEDPTEEGAVRKPNGGPGHKSDS